jgi:hypothetical protein
MIAAVVKRIEHLLSKSCKFFGTSIELQNLHELHQSKLPHQLPPNYKPLNPPSHHRTPQTIDPDEKCIHVAQCEGYALTSLVVRIEGITHDKRARNVTVRSEI